MADEKDTQATEGDAGAAAPQEDTEGQGKPYRYAIPNPDGDGDDTEGQGKPYRY